MTRKTRVETKRLPRDDTQRGSKDETLNIHLYCIDQEWGVQEVFTGLYTRDQHAQTKETRVKKGKRKNTMEYNGNGGY